MAANKISRLCQSVLPAEFEQVKRQTPGLQHFLEENLPDAVKQSVTVLTINPDEIVIAANSPMVANYLRLHSKEIQQQIRETFHFEQTLKFRTVPDSLLKLERQRQQGLPQPRQVSVESIEALERNAQWIEDEDLKAAMLSLAESLKSR
jgi:hypothetical protein